MMGGAENIVRMYACELNKNIFDVSVVCYDGYESPYLDELSDKGVNVIDIGRNLLFPRSSNFVIRNLRNIEILIRLKKVFHMINPDIIHEHLNLNRMLKYIRPQKTTSIIYTQHYSVDRWKRDFPEEVKNAKFLSKNYSFELIALNNSMREELLDIFPNNNISVLQNGINVELFSAKINIDSKKHQLGIPPDNLVIGHVGRFNRIKNHTFLIDVFAEIQKIEPKSVLVLVGSGEDEDKIIDKLNRLKLKEKCIILNDRTDVNEILKTFNILIFPSISEGLPVTLIESQFAGIKSLVSDAVSHECAISNLIKFKSINDSPYEWAKSAISLINHEQKIEYYNAEKWNIKAVVRELEKIYIRLYERSKTKQ